MTESSHIPSFTLHKTTSVYLSNYVSVYSFDIISNEISDSEYQIDLIFDA